MTRSLLLLFTTLLLLNSVKAQFSRVADICSGTCSSNIAYPTLFNGKYYFQATFSAEGTEIGVYDGVNAPTVLDVNPGASSSIPGNLLVFNNKLYFSANNDQELWSYDGSTLNLVKNFNTSYISFQSLQNTLYIIAGTELWAYTGSGSPSSVGDLSTYGIYPSTILGSTSTNLYFIASSATSGQEMWRYAGSGLPTVMDINSGSASSIMSSAFAIVNDNIYFPATDGTHGYELWTHSGTGQPTMVYDINNGSGDGVYGNGGIVFSNNKLYFQANDGTNGTELWMYDGSNNPSMVADLNPGPSSSYPMWFAALNSILYFNASDNTHGSELWSYDGVNTPAMIQDVVTGTDSFDPKWLFVFNNKLYMRGNGAGETDSELWQYDPSVVTAIQSSYASTLWSVYPNPLRTGETLKANENFDKVKAFNAQGNLVYDGEQLPSFTQPGLYHVELEKDNEKATIKVIVQ